VLAWLQAVNACCTCPGWASSRWESGRQYRGGLFVLRLADAPEVGIALAPGMRSLRPAAGVAGMTARISGVR